MARLHLPFANLDAQNSMRNEIDDYLYELREESGIELGLDDMDLIVENSIDIARLRASNIAVANVRIRAASHCRRLKADP